MPAKKPIAFADWKKKKEDEGSIVFALSDGSEVKILPRFMWPAADGEETNGQFMARVLGQERYDAFLADGNTFAELTEFISEQLGLAPGE